MHGASSHLSSQLLLLALLNACHVLSISPQPASLGSARLTNLTNAAPASDSSWTAALRPFLRQRVIRPLKRPFSKRLRKRSLQCVLDSSSVVRADDENQDEPEDSEETEIWERPDVSDLSADEESADDPTASSSSPSVTSSGPESSDVPSATGAFSLRKTYQGESFFEDWDFYSDTDPTNGDVDYLSRQDATGEANLARVVDGQAIMSVDNSTNAVVNGRRKSVRISTADPVSFGDLIVLDAEHMPTGCSTWPAFWTLGKTKTWPAGGELDILERVNKETSNSAAMHTDEGCEIEDSTAGSGSVGLTDCDAYASDNAGCQIRFDDKKTFGPGFNRVRGGVVATFMSRDGFRIWTFPREDIPQDIEDEDPVPANWGKPKAVFGTSRCDLEEFFEEQSIIINTTLCGDWAGSQTDGCPDECSESVADASNFEQAYWLINYVKIFST